MTFFEHKFARLDEIFAQKPISKLIDDGMKPNWGTGRQNPQQNAKIIFSQILFHFQFFEDEFCWAEISKI